MSESDGAGTPPRAPYFLRAMHAWITDCGQTPQIIVDTRVEGVKVPSGYSDENARIVLNIGFEAVRELELANEAVSFNARFGGVAQSVYVPLRAILGVYSRESGEGMVFNEESKTGGRAEAGTGSGEPEKASEAETDKAKSRPSLKIIK